MQTTVLLVAWLLAAAASSSLASQHDHKYKENEPVKVWVNTVGPVNNPQETYNYFFLPFCKADARTHDEHSWGGLGEVLQGNQLINSQLDIRFKVPKPRTEVCKQTLSSSDADKFSAAVWRHYWYELYLDDLPIWGFVGELSGGGSGAGGAGGAGGASAARAAAAASSTSGSTNGAGAGQQPVPMLYTHKQFNVSYNGDRIIEVNLSCGHPVPITAGATVSFTYSVRWLPTTVAFDERFTRYLDTTFFEHKIHWFSIVNSFMMVLFLTGLVSIILMRTLRKDYARYASVAAATAATHGDLEALERDLAEETGWKLVHGDVFRPPPQRMLLSAAVGTGAQLTLLGLFVILLTIAGSYFEERGTILTTFIVCYALTSFVGGYVSGGLYARGDGRAWIRTMMFTALLFPGVVSSIAAILNTIAIAYHSLAAVPFFYIVAVLMLWAFLSFPLCVLGTIASRRWSAAPDAPCRVKRIPSAIPASRWYLRPPTIVLAGGLLPFGSIFIEMYFIFTSFWNYKVYYVYGFTLLVFCILIAVTACVTIVGTYFLLNAENYHWQWTSFGMAASTSVYVFLYATHYFVFRTHMTGFFQTAFYFGYTSMVCFGLALMCGAVGYWAAAAFVYTIYRQVKCD